MRLTVYKCDRCGAEDRTNEIDLHRVGIHVDNFEFKDAISSANNDWCRNCIKEIGLGYLVANIDPLEVANIDPLEDTVDKKLNPKLVGRIIEILKSLRGKK